LTTLLSRPSNSPNDGENAKIDSLLKKSRKVLSKISTHKPFSIYQDSIIIDEVKIEIIHRFLWGTEKIVTALIKDLKGAQVQTGLYHSSLIIQIAGLEFFPETIGYLEKNEALKTRRLIHGLIACDKNGIDITKIEDINLIDNLEEIGRGRKN
jgi:hypothetical protein